MNDPIHVRDGHTATSCLAENRLNQIKLAHVRTFLSFRSLDSRGANCFDLAIMSSSESKAPATKQTSRRNSV